MLEKLIENDKFCKQMHKNTSYIISLMLSSGVEFGVICSTDGVVFEPELPDEIKKHIKPISLFVLSNYSFESAYLNGEDDTLCFEAGFGADNYASLVTIDLDSIIQIVVEDTPVYINICAGKQKSKKKSSVALQSDEESGTKRSMEKLLSRAENKKFLK